MGSDDDERSNRQQPRQDERVIHLNGTKGLNLNLSQLSSQSNVIRQAAPASQTSAHSWSIT